MDSMQIEKAAEAMKKQVYDECFIQQDGSENFQRPDIPGSLYGLLFETNDETGDEDIDPLINAPEAIKLELYSLLLSYVMLDASPLDLTIPLKRPILNRLKEMI